jgi:two-component system, OmpR family, phosphate regulon sensor histidine kinase PhoR
MFSQKDLSPRQLAALTAILIAVPTALGILVFSRSWLICLASLVTLFLGCYALILYTLQKFIYRKIKLIYKFIYQTKATKREEFYYENILPKKGIDEVRADVEQWATQRKAEIEDLKQTEKYRKEFLQNLSHELKTPVFAIQGYVETLLSGAINNTELSKKFLKNTANNVERLTNLLTDLDDISKLETGERPLHYTYFEIQELLEEVFSTVALTAKEKNIQYRVKPAANKDFEVYADKQKIRQVLTNLIENAIKYGKQNGYVESAFYVLDGKNVLVEVSDDGDGIAEEHLPRLFERFYRTDEARSRNIGGSGLGLAICKHIIEAHNQTLHVRSKLNVGSTFGFTLAIK